MGATKAFGALALAGLFSLGGCEGKDIEGDAQQIIELRCKAIALGKGPNAAAPDNVAEMRKVAAEAGQLQMKLAGKYSGEDASKFAEVLADGIQACM